MFHFSVRVFGRRYTLQRDDVWAGRGLGWLWSYREPSGAVRYHCGAWVLWMEGLLVPPIPVPGEGVAAAPAVHTGPRLELECGRLMLSF
jgi:hypothetical protein